MLELYWQLIELDPSLHLMCPPLASLLDYWNDKRGPRLMPSRADIDPTDTALRSHLGMIVLTDAIGRPPRYRYRLIGSKITAAIGRDATGRWLDEIHSPTVREKRVLGYDWAVEHRVPARTTGDLQAINKQWVRVETLILPLSGDGYNVDMILSASCFLGQTRPKEDSPDLI